MSGDEYGAGSTTSAVDLVELRVGMAGLAAEVGRMRADLAPLAALPTQLQASTDLLSERLTNEVETRKRDTADLQAELAKVHKRVDHVNEWQTWVIRLVLGAVVLAGLGLLGLRATG